MDKKELNHTLKPKEINIGNKILDHSKMRINSAQAVLYQEGQALYAMAEALENTDLGKEFIHALHLIEKARETGKLIVTGMGKSGHVGKKIAATFASMGTPSFFLHPSEAAHGDLGMITKKDVLIAISNSGEVAEIFPVINYCNHFKIPLIGITRNRKSTLARKSNIVLVIPDIPEACPIGKAPTTSTTMTIALGDALAVVMAERWGLTKEVYKYWHPGGKLGSSLIYIKDIYNKKTKFLKVKEAETIETIINAFNKLGSSNEIAVVNNKGKLTGKILIADLLKQTNTNKTAKEIMKQPIAIEEAAAMFDASKTLSENNITSCFVVKKEKPIGIVTTNDLMRTSS